MFIKATTQKKVSDGVINRRKFNGVKMFSLSIKMQIKGLFGGNFAETSRLLTDKEKALLINLGYSISEDTKFGKIIISW